MRGLKQKSIEHKIYTRRVAPSRVRGLKPTNNIVVRRYVVAPSRVRGLKQRGGKWLPAQQVAPSRVRGLKRAVRALLIFRSCRTFTGAWIETYPSNGELWHQLRRTFTGAWIETFSRDVRIYDRVSHLHGCVD